MLSSEVGEVGVMFVTLKSYLEEIAQIEKTKPVERRREVPTMAELAKAAGIHPMTMSRWVNGITQTTNHNTVATIIHQMRCRGFSTDISDLMAYRPKDKSDQTEKARQD